MRLACLPQNKIGMDVFCEKTRNKGTKSRNKIIKLMLFVSAVWTLRSNPITLSIIIIISVLPARGQRHVDNTEDQSFCTRLKPYKPKRLSFSYPKAIAADQYLE